MNLCTSSSSLLLSSPCTLRWFLPVSDQCMAGAQCKPSALTEAADQQESSTRQACTVPGIRTNSSSSNQRCFLAGVSHQRLVGVQCKSSAFTEATEQQRHPTRQACTVHRHPAPARHQSLPEPEAKPQQYHRAESRVCLELLSAPAQLRQCSKHTSASGL